MPDERRNKIESSRLFAPTHQKHSKSHTRGEILRLLHTLERKKTRLEQNGEEKLREIVGWGRSAPQTTRKQFYFVSEPTHPLGSHIITHIRDKNARKMHKYTFFYYFNSNPKKKEIFMVRKKNYLSMNAKIVTILLFQLNTELLFCFDTKQ